MAQKKITNPTSSGELIVWLLQNNPGVTFGLWDEDLPQRTSELFIKGVVCDEKSGEVRTKEGKAIKLPEGFYYNDKNGITNKHRSASGVYCALNVLDLDKLDEGNKRYVQTIVTAKQSFNAQAPVATTTAGVVAPAKTVAKKTTKEKVVDGARKVGRAVKNAATKVSDYVLGKDIGRGK